MSFILEALKKLEQKRQHGSVPDLTTVHIPDTRSSRKHRPWLYLFFAALILNAGILTLLFIPRGSEKQILPGSASVEHQNEQDTATGDWTNVDIKVSSLAPSPSAKISDPSGAVSSGSYKASTEDSASRINNYDKQSQKKIQARHIEQKRVQEHSSKFPSQADNHVNLNLPEKELPDNSSSNTLRSRSSEVSSPPPLYRQNNTNKTDPQQDIPELSLLPQSIRLEIPPLKVLGHIYSDSTATRMVNINGDIFREGDTVTKNIKVEQITENGVIFNHDGLRFLIRAF